MLFRTLVSGNPSQRKHARAALSNIEDLPRLATVAFRCYDRSGDSEILFHLRGILENRKEDAWDSLKSIANVGREECELFIAPVVRCPGVSDAERSHALRALASNPSPLVRSRIFEYVSELPREPARMVLDILAKDPDSEIKAEAERLLSPTQ